MSSVFIHVPKGSVSLPFLQCSRCPRTRGLRRSTDSSNLHVLFETATLRRIILQHDLSVSTAHSISALSGLQLPVVRILGDHRSIRNVSIVSAIRGNEDVEPARDHEAQEEKEQDYMTDAESQNVKRVPLANKRSSGVDEVGVGERVDDCQDGTRHVFN